MHYLGWDSKLLQFIVLYKTWCMSTPLLNERIKRERWLNGTVKCFRLICSEHVRWFWNCSILPIRHFGYMLSLWQTNHYVFYVMSYWVNPFSYIVNIINYMQIEAGYFQLLASFCIKLLFYITCLKWCLFIFVRSVFNSWNHGILFLYLSSSRVFWQVCLLRSWIATWKLERVFTASYTSMLHDASKALFHFIIIH